MKMLLILLLVSSVSYAEDCVFCETVPGKLPSADTYYADKLADALADKTNAEEMILRQEYMRSNFPHLFKNTEPAYPSSALDALARQQSRSSNSAISAIILGNMLK